MKCVEVGSKVVTILIIAHGSIVDLDLNNEYTDIFQNVKLYSYAGGINDSVISVSREKNIKRELDNLFQKELTSLTSPILEEYAKTQKTTYRKILEKEEDIEDKENICQVINNITYDKIIGTYMCSTSSIFSYISSTCFGNYNIYIISIHEAISPNNYKLIFPLSLEDKRRNNIENLDNLRYISKNFFGKNLIDLKQFSSDFPVYRIEEEKIKLLSEEESVKKQLIQELKQKVKMETNNYMITVIRNKIENIKLSVLVEIIKQMIGDNCYINLFDYTCNTVSHHIDDKTIKKTAEAFLPSKISSPYAPTEESRGQVMNRDIEEGNPNWGGKKQKNKKRRTRKKN